MLSRLPCPQHLGVSRGPQPVPAAPSLGRCPGASRCLRPARGSARTRPKSGALGGQGPARPPGEAAERGSAGPAPPRAPRCPGEAAHGGGRRGAFSRERNSPAAPAEQPCPRPGHGGHAGTSLPGSAVGAAPARGAQRSRGRAEQRSSYARALRGCHVRSPQGCGRICGSGGWRGEGGKGGKKKRLKKKVYLLTTFPIAARAGYSKPQNKPAPQARPGVQGSR